MNKALKMLDKICERYGYKIRGLYGNVSEKETEIVTTPALTTSL